MADQTIVCPNCKETIRLSNALLTQIQEPLRADLQHEHEKELEKARAQAQKEAEKSLNKEMSVLSKKLESTETKLAKRDREFDKRLAKELESREGDLVDEAKQTVQHDVKKLRSQMRAKNKEIRDAKLRESELEIREEKLEKTVERAVAQARMEARKDTSEKLEAEYQSELMQKDKRLSDANKQVAKLKKQLDQGPQQLQGEVYELHLESVLSREFANDDIVEVPKGVAGADVIQKVRASSGNVAGIIVWESKDTKRFYKSWLKKLRADKRREKADIGVLATTVFPKDFKGRFGQIDGIWVTDFAHVIPVATALRVGLLQVYRIRLAAESKDERLDVIYEYVTGIEFKHRVEAVVEAFIDMQAELNSERLVAEKNWSKREANIRTALLNLAGLYGEMQGITGQELPRIKHLELPPPK